MRASAVNREVKSRYRGSGNGFLCLLGTVLIAMTTPTKSAPVEGDPVHGQTIYARCAACHSLGYNRTGPLHCGVVGRRAGTVDGFEYSQAMRDSHIVWTPDTLNTFLKSPMTMIPGTTMGYVGIPDERERRDLIAYLEKAGRSAETCGSRTSAVYP